jgi:hypothetical protein
MRIRISSSYFKIRTSIRIKIENDIRVKMRTS